MTAEVDHLWAGWRSEYVSEATKQNHGDCVFCALLASDLPPVETSIVWRDDAHAAILNAFPYGTGHALIMPVRHVGELEDLEVGESQGLWTVTQQAVAAVKSAYDPNGVNVGINLGRAAGAGIPGHLHVHVLPRWNADTNFISAVANARVLPEALAVTWEKLRAAWPGKP